MLPGVQGGSPEGAPSEEYDAVFNYLRQQQIGPCQYVGAQASQIQHLRVPGSLGPDYAIPDIQTASQVYNNNFTLQAQQLSTSPPKLKQLQRPARPWTEGTEVSYINHGHDILKTYQQLQNERQQGLKTAYLERINKLGYRIADKQHLKKDLIRLCREEYAAYIQTVHFKVDAEELYVSSQIEEFAALQRDLKFKFKAIDEPQMCFIRWAINLYAGYKSKDNKSIPPEILQQLPDPLKQAYEAAEAFQLPALFPYQDLRVLRLYKDRLLNRGKYRQLYQMIYNSSLQNTLVFVGSNDIIQAIQNQYYDLDVRLRQLPANTGKPFSAAELEQMDVLVYDQAGHEIRSFRQDILQQLNAYFIVPEYNEKLKVILLSQRNFFSRCCWAFLVRSSHVNEIKQFYVLFMRTAMLAQYRADFDIIQFRRILAAADLSGKNGAALEAVRQRFTMRQLRIRYEEDPSIFRDVFERYRRALQRNDIGIQDVLGGREDGEAEDDLQQEIIKMACIDPASLAQLARPVRGAACAHLECFGYRPGYAACPVCRRPLKQVMLDVLTEQLILYACVTHPGRLVQQLEFDVSQQTLLIRDIKLQNAAEELSGWFSDDEGTREDLGQNLTARLIETNRLDVVDISDSESGEDNDAQRQASSGDISIIGDLSHGQDYGRNPQNAQPPGVGDPGQAGHGSTKNTNASSGIDSSEQSRALLDMPSLSDDLAV